MINEQFLVRLADIAMTASYTPDWQYDPELVAALKNQLKDVDEPKAVRFIWLRWRPLTKIRI